MKYLSNTFLNNELLTYCFFIIINRFTFEYEGNRYNRFTPIRFIISDEISPSRIHGREANSTN